MDLFNLLNSPKVLFDSHAHLTRNSSEEIEKILINMGNNGVEYVFDMSINLSTIEESIKLSKENKNIKSFIGLDPEIFIPNSELFEGLDKDENWFENIYKLIQQNIEENREIIAGIGESGLDAYWVERAKLQITNEDLKESVNRLQEKLFRLHLNVAKKNNLPLSIHSRGAEKRCLEIVKEFSNCFGIFHSYTGDYETAKEIIDSGWGLGVNGIFTFQNASELKSMYKKIIGKVSFDWNIEDYYKKGIYFETDSPFLAPEGKRGETNEPSNVAIVFSIFENIIKSS